ncbi:MAG: hypothetical protein AAF725_19780 [Acidobacteriota bacterium]
MTPPTSPAPRRRTSPSSPGVTGLPGGLSPRGWWGLTAALVLAGGLLFWLAREPLGDSLAALTPPLADDGVRAAAGDGGVADPGAFPNAGQPETPGSAADPALITREPEAATWTLVDVSQAVKVAGENCEALVQEGLSELPEFQDFAAGSEGPRVQRERERFNAWGQIWLNRVALIGNGLPPEEACAVHAAMEPACRSLRGVLWTLESVAGADDFKTAEERLFLAEERLDFFLNPPIPEDDPEALEDEDLDGSSS